MLPWDKNKWRRSTWIRSIAGQDANPSMIEVARAIWSHGRDHECVFQWPGSMKFKTSWKSQTVKLWSSSSSHGQNWSFYPTRRQQWLLPLVIDEVDEEIIALLIHKHQLFKKRKKKTCQCLYGWRRRRDRLQCGWSRSSDVHEADPALTYDDKTQKMQKDEAEAYDAESMKSHQMSWWASWLRRRRRRRVFYEEEYRPKKQGNSFLVFFFLLKEASRRSIILLVCWMM